MAVVIESVTSGTTTMGMRLTGTNSGDLHKKADEIRAAAAVLSDREMEAELRALADAYDRLAELDDGPVTKDELVDLAYHMASNKRHH